NNAYCQDGVLTWVNWDLGEVEQDLLDFVKKVFAISRSNPVFRRRRFFAGDPVTDTGDKDIQWMRPDGKEMTLDDWRDPKNRMLGMLIHGNASDDVDERGRR